MVGFTLLALLAAPGRGHVASPATSSTRPQVVAERLATPPRIDGILEDDAWKGPPLPLADWLTYNPLNGDKLAQTTEVHVGYDGRAIYFAFHCVDPEPRRCAARSAGATSSGTTTGWA